MYNIDINFLKDRKLDSVAGGTKIKTKTPKGAPVPILIGTGVAVAFLAATGGALFFLNSQKTSTTAQNAQLDAEIQRLQGQNAEVKKIEDEINAISNEIGILASVFNQIRPWSATLGEISAIIPDGVRIQTISQSGPRALSIVGEADSFDRVNDFVLTLKNSRFFNPEKTILTNTAFASDAQTGKDVRSYTITTEITDTPASELKNLLSERGAFGLYSRLIYLERTGALSLQPAVETPPEQPAEGGQTQ